jgi:hypothetical protein
MKRLEFALSVWIMCTLVGFVIGDHTRLFSQPAGGDVSNSQGAKNMTPEKLKEILQRFPREADVQVDQLAKELIDQMRAPARSAVALLSDPNSQVASNAFLLLGSFEELSIVPRLEAPPAVDGYDRYSDMDQAVGAYCDLRIKVALSLDKMLDDKHPIPWKKLPEAEETPQPSRVCDEAYVMMQHVLRPWVGDDVWSIRRTFLNLSDVEKDAQIRKARKSAEWKVLMGHREE